MSTIDTTTNAGQILASASGGQRRPGDRIFSNLSVLAGITILILLAGVAIFLVGQAWPAITAATSELPNQESLVSYIAPLVFGTMLAAGLAVLIAVPLATAVALFITHIAPRRLAQPLGYVIDLLAAIPSIVYGLWGIAVLGPASVPGHAVAGRQPLLHPVLRRTRLGHRPDDVRGRDRPRADDPPDRLRGRPRGLHARRRSDSRRGRLALGATRWEMIRMTVLPFGKSALISGSMLGLGRALGETMAVAIILSGSGAVTFNLISTDNPSTIAANIALQFPESSGIDVNVLIASGLVLFAITLVVNMAARAVIARSNIQ